MQDVSKTNLPIGRGHIVLTNLPCLPKSTRLFNLVYLNFLLLLSPVFGIRRGGLSNAQDASEARPLANSIPITNRPDSSGRSGPDPLIAGFNKTVRNRHYKDVCGKSLWLPPGPMERRWGPRSAPPLEIIADACWIVNFRASEASAIRCASWWGSGLFGNLHAFERYITGGCRGTFRAGVDVSGGGICIKFCAPEKLMSA